MRKIIIEVENEDTDIESLLLEVAKQVRAGFCSGSYPNWGIDNNYHE
jgi:hypothetical protein